MVRYKYEVVDYASGGFFVHGGNLYQTYFERKEDAQEVCDALNMYERLKVRRLQTKVKSAIAALEDLEEHLKNESICH